MALSKQKNLRKIEIIFTSGEVNPVCHYEYDTFILEDGVELFRQKERENAAIADARTLIAGADVYTPQEF